MANFIRLYFIQYCETIWYYKFIKKIIFCLKLQEIIILDNNQIAL